MKQTTPNAQRSHARVQVVLDGLGEAADAAVLIVPSFSVASRYRKEWANKPYCFGLEITTLPAWVRDRWDLYGDGRRIISPLQRDIMIHQILQEAEKSGFIKTLTFSPGTVKMLSSMAEENLPNLIDCSLSLLDCNGEASRLPQKAERLTRAEREVCQVLTRYEKRLAQEGFCEYTQVLAVLSEAEWPLSLLIFEGINEPSVLEQRFIEKLGARTDIYYFVDDIALPAKGKGRAQELTDLQSCIFDPEPDNPIKPSGALRFLLPAGRYAAPLLLARNLVEYAREGNKTIAVSSANPETLFKDIAPYLASCGFGLFVSARKSFNDTDFGKTWLTLLRFLFEEPYSTFQLSDVMFSAFSGVSHQKAYALDASWRANRAVDRGKCIEDVCSESPLISSVIRFLESGEFEAALRSFEKESKARFSWTVDYRAEQLSAINTAINFVQSFVEVEHGGSSEKLMTLLPLLGERTVAINCGIKGNASNSPRVDLMTLDMLAQESSCSYDAVVLCDLDASVYPVREKKDAKTRLYEKLGIARGSDALTIARRSFYRALSVPVKLLVCERPLNNLDANRAYPAVMFEELLDCYRCDLLSSREIDKLTGLPKVLLPYAERAGEDRLYENLAVVDHPQEVCGQEVLPFHGAISEKSRSKIVLSSRGADEKNTDQLLRLSPSAIESYLACPYQWFSRRRLRLSEIDAGFGPLEMGSFAHHVLKNFYISFQNQGSLKVTPENLSDAQLLLAEIFDQYVERQPSLKKSKNPLIATTLMEEAEIASLKKRLLRYLEREISLLPGFTPRYFEYEFGKKEPLVYGGIILHGDVDRIDVNAQGQAVVIDYKGSLSSDYAFNEASEVPWVSCNDLETPLVLPHKIQTLLYAQAIRKELGLEVVAALYVSYGRDGKVSGAYDQKVLGPAELLGIKPDACEACSNDLKDFSAVLDKIETSIAAVLECLAQGYITPHPRGTDPCSFCPVMACEVRRRA